MRRFRNSVILGTIVIVVLFLTFIYPGMANLDIPPIFTLLFRLFVFVAIVAFFIYILQELRHYQNRCELAERALEVRKTPRGSEEEYIGEFDLRLKVDPHKNYEEIIRQLLKLIQSSLVARTVFLYLYNSADHSYTLQDCQTGTGLELVNHLTAEGSLFQTLPLNPKPQVFSGDKLQDDCLIYYAEPPKVGTLMVVPIMANLEVFLGVIGLDSIDRDAWSHDDIDLVRYFAELFMAVVWQIDTIDQQRTHIQFFRDLCHLNDDLSIGSDPLVLYKEASQILRKFFPFDKLTFAAFKDEDIEELTVEYVEGQEADYNIGHQITINGGLWERILAAEKPSIVNDYDEEQVKFRFQPGDLNVLPFRSCLGAPLVIGRKRIGGLLLESYQAKNFAPEAIEIMNLFAKNLSEILNRIHIYHSMRELAMIDGLTGIFNHRAFKERLQVEIDRCKRYNTTLTLLIMDLDKFKRINDNYGHLCGDLVLKKTANIIRGSIRTVDTVARYGGEEFAVILINADKNGCFNTAERIRSNIQAFHFEKDNMHERMTISIGMAEYPADAADMQSLIAAADMSMYHSKRLGGNKITLYKPDFDV